MPFVWQVTYDVETGEHLKWRREPVDLEKGYSPPTPEMHEDLTALVLTKDPSPEAIFQILFAGTIGKPTVGAPDKDPWLYIKSATNLGMTIGEPG